MINIPIVEHKQPYKKIFNLKLANKIIAVLIFVIVFDFFLFPVPALASEYKDINSNTTLNFTEEEYQINLSKLEEIKNYNENFTENLPLADIYDVKRYTYRQVTAYTSDVGQCDGAPCLTANGFNLCEHGIEDSVAANWLAFGTKIRIPDLYGDKVFIVRDRMNSRYSDMVDIWFKSKEEAKKFGIKIAKIEILE